jgi:hypothetical protein
MFPRLIQVCIVTGLSLGYHELWGQRVVPLNQMSEAHRRLSELGDLRLKTYSIHGLAPLVVLFTEAPETASEVERRYRQQLTSTLIWNIERLHASLFSLHPRHKSGNSDDQMKQDALAAFQIFRDMQPWARPDLFIGFADGARAAAQMLLRDSLPAGLVALAPLTSSDRGTRAQDALWLELLRPADHPRPVMVLESMCNGPFTWLAQAAFQRRQTILILAQYDGWLSQRTTSACPKTPTRPMMDYDLISMVIDWMSREHTLRFPT